MSINRELVAASSRPLILSILSRGESYGYEIIQTVRQLSEGEMQWTDGMLYPVLHRLEKEGMIVAEWKQSENGRRRKYYQIKSEGRKELKHQHEQWQMVNGVLGKLMRTA